jgi:hypothetical protein
VVAGAHRVAAGSIGLPRWRQSCSAAAIAGSEAPSRSTQSRAGCDRIWPLASTTTVVTAPRPSVVSWVRSASNERLDRPQRPAEHRSDAAVGREHRHRQDHDRLARDARRRDAGDHRPVLAHRVLEVVAVGDVALRVARAVLVADEDDLAVERDDENAGEERREDALVLDELSELRRVAEGGRRQLHGDAAQGALQADQPLRHRRRDPARVVFLRVEDDLLAAAPDLAQDEDDGQRHAGEDQHRAGQRDANLQGAKTERFPGRAHSCFSVRRRVFRILSMRNV